ncbi:MAG: VIT1/CCC1 transporter family protein [Chlamydiia bacterium]|nr:VIT1/CCC1 transporter family protein [Chlamydiia bacterium]
MDTPKPSPLHFQGKEAIQHVIDARLKGIAASEEIHGAELPGHYSAAADTAKETTFILLIFWILLREFGFLQTNIHLVIASFMSGWLIWKTGRSAILGYSRLERLHRLIEEERWEIEHHRTQEREELKALYAAKGFSGKLLEESVDILMADDNRLLQIMLEEELGLRLESYEHPLKQACGALLGGLCSCVLMSIALFFLPAWGPLAFSALLISFAAGTVAHLEKNKPLPAIIWNLASIALASGIPFFIAQLIHRA